MTIKSITLAVAVLGGLLVSTSGSMAQGLPGRQSCRDAEICDMRQSNTYNTTNIYRCNSEYGCGTPTKMHRKQWGSEETIYFDR